MGSVVADQCRWLEYSNLLGLDLRSKEGTADVELLDPAKTPAALVPLDEITHAAASPSAEAPVAEPDEVPDWGEAVGVDRPPIPRRRGRLNFLLRGRKCRTSGTEAVSKIDAES